MIDHMMVFVDGSNLLRATGSEIKAEIRSDKPADDAISLCLMIVNTLVSRIRKEAQFYDCKVLRQFWFGSYQGDEPYEMDLRSRLRQGGMEPVVFRRREGREKRVDIAVAREMMMNAVNGNYDLALLVAGDEDYVDLVEDLKRLGIRVIGSFYKTGLSEHLRLALDNFHELHVWGERRKELVQALGGTLL